MTLTEGSARTFGDITGEVYDTFGFGYEDLNDASLVLRVSVDGMTMTIAGDAERGLEEYAADLLKASATKKRICSGSLR